MRKAIPLLEHISTFCTAQKLIRPNSTIVVGISGGPDSIFLLHFLASIAAQKKLTLIAAHLDHGWRAESGQDAQFCQQMAKKYKVPFISKSLKDIPLKFKFNGSKEEMGRKARRAFFEQVAKEHHASAIALAHHADDQMETFFMRLIRGASLTGLAGIKHKDGLYIRPLLSISKQEILDYLHEHQISYRVDASNQSDEYLRNRIRNQVIYALRAADERFEKNFAATHTKLVETEEFLQELATITLQDISVENKGLDNQKLLALNPVIRNRVLIKWLIIHKVPFCPSQGLLDEICRFLENSKSNKHTLYGKWQLLKNDNELSLSLL